MFKVLFLVCSNVSASSCVDAYYKYTFSLLDFLKILTQNIDTIDKVFKNTLLSDVSVYQKVNKNFRKKPNEFNQAKFIKEYKGVYFCFYTRKIDNDDVFTKLEILFKPHYYFNDNLHNANDFSVQDCINVLNEFIELYV